MPPEMIACPQCGEANSNQKRICHHCQAELARAATRGSASRPPTPQKPPPERLIVSFPQAPTRGTFALSDYIIGVSLRQRAQFYRQMYSMLNAGIPLGLSLSHSTENIAVQMRGRVKTLSDHVMSGGLLSEGMSRYPALFPEWEVSVMLAAEKAGTLPQVMHDIADTLEMEWDLRARTRAATFHLKMTALVALIVLLLLGSLGILGGGGINTEVSPDIFGILGRVGYLVGLILLLLFALVIGWRAYGRTRNGGRVLARITPRVPLIGPIMLGMARIRFVRVLSAMWHAGVSPLESLTIAARTTNNYHLMYQIADMSQHITKGVTISSVIAGTNFLPQQALYLLQTGETTGDVSAALDKIAEYYTIELDAQAKTLPIKIQLLMYAILVPLVGWLVITFWSKYFNALLGGQ